MQLCTSAPYEDMFISLSWHRNTAEIIAHLTWSIATNKLATFDASSMHAPITNPTPHHSLARGTVVSNFHAI